MRLFRRSLIALGVAATLPTVVLLAVGIVDFAMPQTNGAEVARAATLRQPGLRILMVSGYSDSAAIEGILENVQLLMKPFTAVDLISAARGILSDKRTGAKT